MTARSTVLADELDRFGAIAEQWWDPAGKFRPLHELNPARVAFVRDHLAAWFGRDARERECLRDLSVLDLGCGGGLISEPLARAGARVTGIDAEKKSIAIARVHAQAAGLDIDYQCTNPENLAALGQRFDAVVSLEVIEHVADVDAFIGACAELIRPGGALVLATLNRTAKSLLLAKIGAEYLLRWLPIGTHDWRKFLKPSELAAHLRRHRLELGDVAGFEYDVASGVWSVGRDLAVNYAVFATKPFAG